VSRVRISKGGRRSAGTGRTRGRLLSAIQTRRRAQAQHDPVSLRAPKGGAWYPLVQPTARGRTKIFRGLFGV